MLDKQLLGNFIDYVPSKEVGVVGGPTKYLALHLRFEVDMVAYSLCDFGGGETEKKELQAYRETHFPLLIERLKKSKYFTGFFFFFGHNLSNFQTISTDVTCKYILITLRITN